MNKSLESQILAKKSHQNNDESKFLEQALKITSLNEKINKLVSQKNEIDKERRDFSANFEDKVRIINEKEVEIKKLKTKEG